MTDARTIADGLSEGDGRQREGLIVERINQRAWAIAKAVPPIEPDAMHWLESDCSASYCSRCAIDARGREFELGPLLVAKPWYERDEWQDIYFEGISSAYDYDSDVHEFCATCGKTLSHILTDYGVDEELDYYIESPLAVVTGEESYTLDRIALNVWDGMSRSTLLRTAIVINQAFRLIAVRAVLEKQP